MQAKIVKAFDGGGLLGRRVSISVATTEIPLTKLTSIAKKVTIWVYPEVKGYSVL